MALSLLLDKYDAASLDILVRVLEMPGVSVGPTICDSGEVYFDLIREKKLSSPAVFAFVDWHLVHEAVSEGLVDLEPSDIDYALQAALKQGFEHAAVRLCMGFMSSLQTAAARRSGSA